ncbi:MAG: hypothetical protein PHU80_03990, partial [Kiritimatiellae bacterium]|nr:hypothetical protein [Kiritimatiellia bacterium]
MTHRSRWLTLGVTVVAGIAITCLYAQDDLEALLKDLGAQPKKPAAEAAQPETKPAETAPAPAPAPAAVEAPAAPAPAAAAEAAPAPEAAPVAVAPAPAVEAPAAPAPVAAAPAEVAPAAAAEAAPAPEAAPAAVVPAAAAEAAPAPAAVVPAAAEAAPAPEIAVPAVATEDHSVLVSELMTLETIRRKSLDDHGYASLEAARKAMEDGDYTLAREQYKQALEFIGNRPATIVARDEAKAGMGEAFYLEARQALKRGDTEKALPLAAQAKEFNHPKADRLIETLKAEPKRQPTDTSGITHRVNEPEYKEQRDEIRRRLRRSRQYYTTGEYDKALEECELILRDNPMDTEAMSLRDRIADRMKTVADVEFEATRSLMIRDVRKTWTPERYAIESAQMPKGKGDMTSKTPTVGISDTKTAEQLVQQKLVNIVIPEVTFRPPATIIDAVDFFKQASRDFDSPETPVEQRGVNLVLKLPSEASAAPAADAAADPFAAPASAASSGVPQISALSARFINLYDALKLVCDVTGMKFRIRGNIVMIVPANEPDAELMTRSYNVLSSLTERMSAAQSEMGQPGGGGDSTFMMTTDMSTKQDWKAFFQQLGVQWPDGSSISYLTTIGKLRVTNTGEQLAVFEQVLEDLNVTPRMIEIEARFVEVSQRDLNSLGFEWLLNSDYSFNIGGVVGKALGLKEMTPVNSVQETVLVTPADPIAGTPDVYETITTIAGRVPLLDKTGNQLYNSDGQPLFTSQSRLYDASVNAIDGTTYSTGQRYLSTMGNPIAGQGAS